MNWWRRFGLPEKLFCLSLVIYAAAVLLGRSGLAGFLTLCLGAVVLVRLARAGLRKVIWRLRNRLIVSYLFIAVVPITLLITLVVIVSYVVIGQMAIYVVSSELDRHFVKEGAPAQIPTQEFLSTLVPDLGDVFFLDNQQDLRRHHVPPPVNGLDVEFTWASPVKMPFGNAVVAVRSRPSAVLGHIFGQRMEWGEGVLLIAAALAALFLVVQLISIFIGARMTQTITSEVHDLYEGTQRVKEGDFSHRIAVRGDDQLAELSRSFNGMTENLQRLIIVEKEKERLQSELEIARQVQSRLFPKAGLSLQSLELSGICRPASVVSGDYYDFLQLPESALAMALGDVAGKGISAALLMAAIQSGLRSQLAAASGMSTAEIMSVLNKQLYASTPPEKYATLYFAVYDELSGLLTYTNAGHLPPLLLHNGAASQLEVTGTVVGAFPTVLYREEKIELEPGDLLVAYTDGVVEPENDYGQMFGEERLIELLARHQTSALDEIFARTLEALQEWTGATDMPDDMTMLLARRRAPQ